MNCKGKAGALLTGLCIALVLLVGSCGKNIDMGSQKKVEVENAAITFLDACGNQEIDVIVSMLTDRYKAENGIGESITREDLRNALGTFQGYRFQPDSDLVIEDGRALIAIMVDYGNYGRKEETLVLTKEDIWRVDSFTALRWRSVTTKQADKGNEEKIEEVSTALKRFLDACINGDTKYIFDHLTKAYKEEHRLTKPWTSAEFAGIFGEARSYKVDSSRIELESEKKASVDVTIYFGSRGNLQEETSRVSLVFEGSLWKISVFPFFIY